MLAHLCPPYNMIFHTFDAELQKFLLCTAHLSTFTEKHAKMLCGHNDIGHHLEEALRIGSFLSFTPPDFYSFHPLFHRYLMWKQKKVLHTEDLNRCYEISALYYMLEDNLPMALAFYSLADNQQKISELLIKNADKHAGNGYFYETSQYYLSLPEQLVQQSTELMSALCMIYSLRCKTEESEYYFNLLAEFEKHLSKKDPRKKDAQQRLAYLTIALPHRGIVNLIDIFKKFSALIHSNTLHLQTMSITGNMPSMMNGGKDFCEWSKKDVFLYKTMKNAMYTVLGKSSHGFAEIGLGESLFEKNTDGNFTEELTLLNIGFYEAQISGNIQLQFAALAVMARIYVTQGKLQSAIQTFEKFRFKIDSASDIARNIDAFSAYLHMLAGDAEYVNRWFEKEAPDEYQCFYITERYRYLTKIKIYLIKKMYSEALSLLSRVDQYFMDYARVYCHMEAMILKAIILYRSKDPTWRQVFNDALNLCGEYKFVRIISKFGVAVLDMLKNTMAGGNANYLEILLENTKKQAVLYPKYLRAETKIDYNLTETERSVLKLVSDGLTNNEIAELMDISIRTVKFHLTNIYAKLEVKNRSSAIRIAGEIDLL